MAQLDAKGLMMACQALNARISSRDWPGATREIIEIYLDETERSKSPDDAIERACIAYWGSHTFFRIFGEKSRRGIREAMRRAASEFESDPPAVVDNLEVRPDDLASQLRWFSEKKKWPKGLEGMPELLAKAADALSAAETETNNAGSKCEFLERSCNFDPDNDPKKENVEAAPPAPSVAAKDLDFDTVYVIPREMTNEEWSEVKYNVDRKASHDIDLWRIKEVVRYADFVAGHRGRAALSAQVQDVAGWKPKEIATWEDQQAFEAWAQGERYEMHQHPLHYLFMDTKTNAARQGWKAALQFVRDRFAAAPAKQEGATGAD